MSGLNDSVIICDAFPKSSQKQAPARSRRQKIPTKKTFYESPLRHIQLSTKRWEQLQTQKKLLRNARRTINNKQNVFSLVKEDSVIILSDNECEVNKEEDENKCTNNERSRKRSLKQEDEGEPTVQFSLRNSNRTQAQEGAEVKAQPKKKRKIESDGLLDNDLSCLILSDTEDTEITTVQIDNENRAPSNSVKQGSDDIMVVWSSTKGCSPSKSQSPKETTSIPCEESNARVFMIDYNRNVQNLNCLSNKEPQTEPCEKDAQNKCKEDAAGLLFNKPGLVLPQAENISKRIVMQKPKTSFCAFRQQLEQQALRTPAASSSASSSQATGGQSPKLREIIIDGSNVAMAHKNHKIFSEEGLQIVIDYFRSRGHSVKVFIPQCRRSYSRPLLEKWYTEGIVIFTPSRYIRGRWITSYDDRFILQYATICGGIVVSSDQFRDLYTEKPEWRDTIENRLLQPTFVGDIVLFPEDPLGRKGPKLDEFLRH